MLAGELSLMAALAANHLVRSHMQHNRKPTEAAPTNMVSRNNLHFHPAMILPCRATCLIISLLSICFLDICLSRGICLLAILRAVSVIMLTTCFYFGLFSFSSVCLFFSQEVQASLLRKNASMPALNHSAICPALVAGSEGH